MDTAKLKDQTIDLKDQAVESERSILDVISEGIGSENKEALDRLFTQARQAMDSSTAYVNKNPREALLIAAAVGLGAYVLMNTKPGRTALDKGVEAYLPRLRAWLNELFASAQSEVSAAVKTAQAQVKDAAQAIQHH